MNLVRGLILIAGASLVLSALTSCLVLKMATDLARGIGIQAGDPMTLGISLLGGGLVLGISARALWRERASTGWRLYGVLITLIVMLGSIGGAVMGTRLSDDRFAYVRGVAADTCVGFRAVHPELAADCEARAIPCREQVHAHPPVAQRGLSASDVPGTSAEPRDPEERAIWACLEQP